MKNLILSPIEAASIRGGEYADQHFLSLSPLEKGLDLKTAQDEFTRHVLFTFDLTPLTNVAFQKIFFRPAYVHVQGNCAIYCDVHRVADDWNTDTVTWNTRPEYGEVIYQNGAVAPYVEMDITDAIRAALKKGDTRLSLCMKINHHCEGNIRAGVDAKKTCLVVTDEDRDEWKLRLTDDNPDLSLKQKALLTYLPTSWRTKIQRVNEEIGDRFAFVIQTDTHMFDRNNPAAGNNARALTAFAPMAFIANLGDLIRGYKYEEDNSDNLRACMKELTRRYVEDCPCPVLMTIGNHDHNGMWCKLHETDDLITKAEHFAYVQQPLKAHNGAAMVTDPDNVNGDSLYCYMDFEEADVRVILVDSTDNGTEFNSFKVSDRQLEWLETVALKTDKQVMIMTHTPFTVDFPGAGNRLTGGDRVLEIVESFIQKGGRFIAYLYGHTHAQNQMRDQNGRMHVSFVNGSYAEIVILDTENGKLQTYGFGAAKDREINYR